MTLFATRRRRILARLALYLGFPGLVVGGTWFWLFWMPGDSFEGKPPLAASEAALVEPLRRHVERLAGEIGERNEAHPDGLAAAARHVEESLAAAGYTVGRHAYTPRHLEVANLEVEIPGTDLAGEIVVVGAHYDSFFGAGADDNASGTAALLELARLFRDRKPRRTLRFVAFVNEEPPNFQRDTMGSLVYARRCRERGEAVVAMVSLEMLGTFQEWQEYPSWIYGVLFPDRGDYIAFLGNPASRALVHRSIRAFREHATIPSEGAVLPERTIGVSDQWSFWQVDYPAIMVTDTAYFRNERYHTPEDVPERLDYEGMARVVAGLVPVVEALTSDD